MESPNQWWVSDLSYIKTTEGFLFLVVVMDLFAHYIIDWATRDCMLDDLVLDAVTMAYWRRCPSNKVMLHSNQGSQYKSRDCRTLLTSLNIELA